MSDVERDKRSARIKSVFAGVAEEIRATFSAAIDLNYVDGVATIELPKAQGEIVRGKCEVGPGDRVLVREP